MSVYIKGMEMPTDKAVFLILCPDGRVAEKVPSGLIGDYEAIPVPPHGRLGDLDAMEAECTDEKGSYYSYDAAIVGEAVSSAPTIIPADPIKEETE